MVVKMFLLCWWMSCRFVLLTHMNEQCAGMCNDDTGKSLATCRAPVTFALGEDFPARIDYLSWFLAGAPEAAPWSQRVSVDNSERGIEAAAVVEEESVDEAHFSNSGASLHALSLIQHNWLTYFTPSRRSHPLPAVVNTLSRLFKFLKYNAKLIDHSDRFLRYWSRTFSEPTTALK